MFLTSLVFALGLALTNARPTLLHAPRATDPVFFGCGPSIIGEVGWFFSLTQSEVLSTAFECIYTHFAHERNPAITMCAFACIR